MHRNARNVTELLGKIAKGDTSALEILLSQADAEEAEAIKALERLEKDIASDRTEMRNNDEKVLTPGAHFEGANADNLVRRLRNISGVPEKRGKQKKIPSPHLHNDKGDDRTSRMYPDLHIAAGDLTRLRPKSKERAHRGRRKHEMSWHAIEETQTSSKAGAIWEGALRDNLVTEDEHVAFVRHSHALDYRRKDVKLSPKKLRSLHNKLRAAAYSGSDGGCDLKGLFKRMDKNHDGNLSKSEFFVGLRRLLPMSKQELEFVYNMIDVDHDGNIDINEFIKFLEESILPRKMSGAQEKQFRRTHTEMTGHDKLPPTPAARSHAVNQKHAPSQPARKWIVHGKKKMNDAPSSSANENEERARSAKKSTGNRWDVYKEDLSERFHADFSKLVAGDMTKLRPKSEEALHRGPRKHEISLHVVRSTQAMSREGRIWEGSLRDSPVTENERMAFLPHSEAKNYSRRARIARRKIHMLRNKLRAVTYVGVKGRDMRTALRRMDKDHNGVLSKPELARALKRILPLSDQEIELVWSMIDANKDGKVDIEEFMAFVEKGESRNRKTSHDVIRSKQPAKIDPIASPSIPTPMVASKMLSEAKVAAAKIGNDPPSPLVDVSSSTAVPSSTPTTAKATEEEAEPDEGPPPVPLAANDASAPVDQLQISLWRVFVYYAMQGAIYRPSQLSIVELKKLLEDCEILETSEKGDTSQAKRSSRNSEAPKTPWVPSPGINDSFSNMFTTHHFHQDPTKFAARKRFAASLGIRRFSSSAQKDEKRSDAETTSISKNVEKTVASAKDKGDDDDALSMPPLPLSEFDILWKQALRWRDGLSGPRGSFGLRKHEDLCFIDFLWILQKIADARQIDSDSERSQQVTSAVRVLTLTNIVKRAKKFEPFADISEEVKSSRIMRRYRKSLRKMYRFHTLSAKEKRFDNRLLSPAISLHERERRLEAKRHARATGVDGAGVEYIRKGENDWSSGGAAVASSSAARRRVNGLSTSTREKCLMTLDEFVAFTSMMDFSKGEFSTAQITERQIVAIFVSSYASTAAAIAASMESTQLRGLTFDEFLCAVARIASIIFDGTYASVDKPKDAAPSSSSNVDLDTKLLCCFFQMGNVLQLKHDEIAKGKFTTPFAMDEYRRKTAKEFMRIFLSDYNSGRYSKLFDDASSAGQFPTKGGGNQSKQAANRRKNRELTVDDLFVFV
eukprot:g3010.t1